jgi:MoaA/NifB/PqqE/SkfB family radical SAM enzyme
LYRDDERKNIDLAHILAESAVTRVSIGGGEPTLVRNLAEVTHILKQRGKYVSLHTNGLLLDDRMIADLEVDDIALPLDSISSNAQQLLRGERFLATVERLPDMISSIHENGIDVGYHTVFTSFNQKDIPLIYENISKSDFLYWRIYEFNDDLAMKRTLRNRGSENDLTNWIRSIEDLMGIGTPAKGFTDGLLAQFLIMEQRMSKHNDRRIQFVGRRDISQPYMFLENSGDVSYYNWLSMGERRALGNYSTRP